MGTLAPKLDVAFLLTFSRFGSVPNFELISSDVDRIHRVVEGLKLGTTGAEKAGGFFFRFSLFHRFVLYPV